MINKIEYHIETHTYFTVAFCFVHQCAVHNIGQIKIAENAIFAQPVWTCFQSGIPDSILKSNLRLRSPGSVFTQACNLLQMWSEKKMSRVEPGP